jgi:hypothetical protein
MKAFPLRMKSSPFGRWRSRAVPWKTVVWWIALTCAVVGILTELHLVVIPLLAGYSFRLVLAGLILLLVATR